MKINTEDAPKFVSNCEDVQVGNVYKTQAGHIHVIVGVMETRHGSERACALVFKDGEVTNAVCYGSGYYRMRSPIGFCTTVMEDLEIEWF